MQLISSFLVLSTLGLINSSYLIWAHYKKKPMICPLNHDCSIVTESRWSHIFFIRNEILGLLFFMGMLIAILLAISLPIFMPVILLIILIATIGALLFSIFLIFIQIYSIKDYCFYCILSALITLLLFLNSLLLYMQK